MIGAGNFLARGESARITYSKNGTLGVEVRFKLSDGAGHITETFWFSDPDKAPPEKRAGVEQSVEISVSKLVTCGLGADEIAAGQFDGIGRCEVELVIEMQDWNGREYPRVKYVNRPRPSLSGEERSGAESALKRIMRTALPHMAGDLESKSPARTEASSPADQDIPF